MQKKLHSRSVAIGTSLIVVVFGLLLFLTYNTLFLADGYIFLQYAKNIAIGKGWAFNPHEISFGTSSITWTLILVPLYRLFPQNEQFIIAAVVVGIVCYCLFLKYFFDVAQKFGKDEFSVCMLFLLYALFPFNGFFTAMSAMETGLYLFLFFLIVNTLLSDRNSILYNLSLGILIALLFLTRIEGLFLLLAIGVINLLRKEIRALSLVITGFGLTSLPWFYFIHIHSDSFIPTSGTGRLWGYLSTTLPSISLNEYIQSSIFQKISFIPEVIKTQFINHPVVLLTCLVPYLFVSIVYSYILLTKQKAAKKFQVATLLIIYCTLNLFAYLIFQPLIFQRYLVTFLPVAIIFGAMIIPARVIRSGKIKFSVLSTAVIFILVSNFLGIRYYQIGVKLNQNVVNLFQKVNNVAKQPCRVSAEPLGVAGYFTKCYIIDQGGLINPPIWDVWLANGGGFGGTIEYSIDQKADYLVLPSTSLPSEYKNKFHLMFVQQELGWGVFQKTVDFP